MQLGFLCLLALGLLLAKVTADELDVVKEIICNGEEDHWPKIKKCYVGKLPPMAQEVIDKCKSQVAPDTPEDDKLRQLACFENTTLATQILECGKTSLRVLRRSAPREQLLKTLQVLECITELYIQG